MYIYLLKYILTCCIYMKLIYSSNFSLFWFTFSLLLIYFPIYITFLTFYAIFNYVVRFFVDYAISTEKVSVKEYKEINKWIINK